MSDRAYRVCIVFLALSYGILIGHVGSRIYYRSADYAGTSQAKPDMRCKAMVYTADGDGI